MPLATFLNSRVVATGNVVLAAPMKVRRRGSLPDAVNAERFRELIFGELAGA